MILEIVTEGLETVRVRASRVLVLQDDGTPVAVAAEIGSGLIAAATAEHADFNPILAQLGLAKPVVALSADPRSGLILPR